MVERGGGGIKRDARGRRVEDENLKVVYCVRSSLVGISEVPNS